MRQLIGDKKFYKMVLTIAIPIIIQNAVTNFVGMMDNIMVGQVGTNQMSGIAIDNQLLLVFNLCLFGAVSGAGIFGAQFFGQDNHEGLRDTMRFKIVLCLLIAILGIGLFKEWGGEIIKLYLHEEGNGLSRSETLFYAVQYLNIMLWGLIPFAISQIYGSTLRETGETFIPMLASVAAVAVNLVFNYILIFGKLGVPTLGSNGAAIATVMSRCVECAIIVGWTHSHQEKNPFIKGIYKHFRIPRHLIKSIMIKGTPILLNETLWAAGMAALNQRYSVRGLSVVAGLNIATTIANLFNVFFMSMGSAVGIIVGPLLGANKMEEAKDTAYKLIFFSTVSSIAVGLVMALTAPFFPRIYNTTFEVRALAMHFILISACCMPLYAYLHSTYFTIRSGGKTMITFLFDSVYLWVVSVPLATFLAYYTKLPILVIYFLCQIIDLIKCIIGFILLKKEVWVHNIVKNEVDV